MYNMDMTTTAKDTTLIKDTYPAVTFRFFDETHTRVDWANGRSTVVDNETADKSIEAHLAAGWTVGAAAG